eukprot:1118699-Rhodomonas_salina.2
MAVPLKLTCCRPSHMHACMSCVASVSRVRFSRASRVSPLMRRTLLMNAMISRFACVAVRRSDSDARKGLLPCRSVGRCSMSKKCAPCSTRVCRLLGALSSDMCCRVGVRAWMHSCDTRACAPAIKNVSSCSETPVSRSTRWLLASEYMLAIETLHVIGGR